MSEKLLKKFRALFIDLKLHTNVVNYLFKILSVKYYFRRYPTLVYIVSARIFYKTYPSRILLSYALSFIVCSMKQVDKYVPLYVHTYTVNFVYKFVQLIILHNNSL